MLRSIRFCTVNLVSFCFKNRILLLITLGIKLRISDLECLPALSLVPLLSLASGNVHCSTRMNVRVTQENRQQSNYWDLDPGWKGRWQGFFLELKFNSPFIITYKSK